MKLKGCNNEVGALGSLIGLHVLHFWKLLATPRRLSVEAYGNLVQGEQILVGGGNLWKSVIDPPWLPAKKLNDSSRAPVQCVAFVQQLSLTFVAVFKQTERTDPLPIG